MLLKSLEIQGFKTFPDKTTLKFDRGITAVVGPNGSGKSNISDAVRWVLGEQSTRTLRCTRMEDVIFNGTPARKPQGYAEVTLTIDNSDRRLDFDGDTDETDTPDTAAASGLEGEIPEKTEPDDENVETEEEEAEPVTVGASDEE